ncbi:MAG: hypothetical protein IKE92_05250 [Clostridiales bacterium]|nr:hypothetical protein [Clostridiales bacterium]
MSLTKAEQLPDALSGITGLKLYHLFKPATIKAPYAVWQEDSEGQSFYASNRKQEQVLELTLDYFTQTEYDPVADNIQDALDEARFAWKLNSFQYEAETKLLHYEWIVQVI